MTRIKTTAPFRLLVGVVLLAFVFASPGISYAQLMFDLPGPGAMVGLTPPFAPALVKGLTIHPENPLQFDFLIDPGDVDFKADTGHDKAAEYRKLIKYFLAALTVPEEDLWVNLSPYEKDRMIPENFGKTEMGRDLLGQDYILKQLTASLMYPEKELGKEFWQKIYQEARARFGTTEIPVNTFNKVWIVADKASVYEHGNTVFLVDSHLKVMLEEDYLAASHQSSGVSRQKNDSLTTEDRRLATQIIKEIILPAIEKEVNEGKNFALLRQINNSLILAVWYKTTLKESLLGKVYADRSKTEGVDQDITNNQKIYEQYLEAFKKGVYNYIKEDYDPVSREMIPRKYFSGGFATEDPSLDNPATPKNESFLSGRIDKLNFPENAQTILPAIKEAAEMDEVKTNFKESGGPEEQSGSSPIGWAQERNLNRAWWEQEKPSPITEEQAEEMIKEQLDKKYHHRITGENIQQAMAYHRERGYFKAEFIPTEFKPHTMEWASWEDMDNLANRGHIKISASSPVRDKIVEEFFAQHLDEQLLKELNWRGGLQKPDIDNLVSSIKGIHTLGHETTLETIYEILKFIGTERNLQSSILPVSIEILRGIVIAKLIEKKNGSIPQAFLEGPGFSSAFRTWVMRASPDEMIQLSRGTSETRFNELINDQRASAASPIEQKRKEAWKKGFQEWIENYVKAQAGNVKPGTYEAITIGYVKELLNKLFEQQKHSQMPAEATDALFYKIAQETNSPDFLESAKRRMDMGRVPSLYGDSLRNDVMKLLEALYSQDHSGHSYHVTLELFQDAVETYAIRKGKLLDKSEIQKLIKEGASWKDNGKGGTLLVLTAAQLKESWGTPLEVIKDFSGDLRFGIPIDSATFVKGLAGKWVEVTYKKNLGPKFVDHIEKVEDNKITFRIAPAFDERFITTMGIEFKVVEPPLNYTEKSEIEKVLSGKKVVGFSNVDDGTDEVAMERSVRRYLEHLRQAGFTPENTVVAGFAQLHPLIRKIVAESGFKTAVFYTGYYGHGADDKIDYRFNVWGYWNVPERLFNEFIEQKIKIREVPRGQTMPKEGFQQIGEKNIELFIEPRGTTKLLPEQLLIDRRPENGAKPLPGEIGRERLRELTEEYFLIGASTYSGKGVLPEDKEIVKSQIRDFLKRYRLSGKVVLESGGTNYGGVELVYDVAEELGIPTISIMTEMALADPYNDGKPMDVRRTNYYFIHGKEWGEESADFQEALSGLLGFGGGAQAKDELLAVDRMGKGVVLLRNIRDKKSNLGASDSAEVVAQIGLFDIPLKITLKDGHVVSARGTDIKEITAGYYGENPFLEFADNQGFPFEKIAKIESDDPVQSLPSAASFAENFHRPMPQFPLLARKNVLKEIERVFSQSAKKEVSSPIKVPQEDARITEEGIMALAEIALTDAVHWTRGGHTVDASKLREILASRLDEALTLDEATRQSLLANRSVDPVLKKLLAFTAQSTGKENFQPYIDALVNYFNEQGIEKVVEDALLKNKDKKVGKVLEVDTGLTHAKVKEFLKAPPSSPATDNFTKGGIDLNPANLNLQIKRDGNGVPLPIEFQDIPNINVNGFIPVIINITPVTNLPLLLGAKADPEEQQLSRIQ